MSLTFRYNTVADSSHTRFSDDFMQSSLVAFKEIINNPQNGFFHLTDKKDFLNSTKEISKKIAHKKHFVQIGIGGSALGPQMLVSSLRKNFDKSFTILDNIDSDFIYDSLKQIDIKQSIFYVVSKSGGTAETIACYSIVRNLLV